MARSLRDQFDESAVRQLTAQDVHHSALYQAAKHDRLRGCRRCGELRARGRRPPHPTVHSQICQPVRMAVLLSQNMLNLKVVELRDAAPRLLIKGAKFGTVHAILALHLFDHEFGVGNDPQALVSMGDGKLEGSKKRGVFGKIIGVRAQVLT